jgi:hypothetical protein
MATAKPKSLQRRLKRTFLIVAGVFAFSILGLHIWFVHNAKDVLKKIVTNKSHGKLKLELSQLTFDFLSGKLKIRQADLVSVDSVNLATTYHIQFRKLTLRVASFWPLLLKHKLLLDSIKLHDPDIEVMQWRRDTTSKIDKDELSIPQEMGRLYNSMLDVLDGFGIKRIMINNAKLSLINKMKPGVKPVTVSNIYFDLFRTADNIKKRDEYVENEQTIDLTTTNQNIALPGGRHNLSFKTFNLHLFRKRIELDSCTITAVSTDSTKSNYKIFFQKLLLIGVDFGAMYNQNLIRADSVYCENPLFDIYLNRSDVTSKSKKKERPDAAKIVRELTGDLELAFVGVKDAGIHVDMSGLKYNRSLFNSNQDDFEMRGLRINADSSSPVTVERFDMLVRDYHLYNEDSSAAYSFDSIHFENNKIVLNNFTVSTESSKIKQRDERDFKIPYFELTGLDWYQLIFEENFKAEEGYLFNPVINYIRKSRSTSRKKTNFFASLQNLGSLMTLNKINIVNGEIHAKLSPNSSFNLQKVNLSLYSNKLLQSTNKEGLRRAVERLSFSDGIIRVKDITAKLGNVRYTGNNLIHADQLSVSSRLNSIKATVNDVYIDNMLLEDETETIVVDGLRWNNATVTLQAPPPAKKKNTQSNLNLRNIAGNNTQLKFSKGKTNISTFMRSIKVSSVNKNGDSSVQVDGLLVTGNNLDVVSGDMKVKAASYQVASDAGSFLNNLQIERFQSPDSLSIKSPRIDFSADINSILAKDIHLTDLKLQAPVVKFIKWHNQVPVDSNKKKPKIRIDKIYMGEPILYVSTHRNDSITTINLPHSENSVINATGFKMNDEGLQLGSLAINTTAATVIKSTGQTLGIEKGKLDVNLSDIRLSKKDGRPIWSGIINTVFLENPNSLSIGKNKGNLKFNQATMGNVNLSSHFMADINQLIKFNVSAWLRTTTGEYIDSITTLKWYNTEYNSTTRTLSLDSFAYYPTMHRDSVINQTPHQTDYITFHSGSIKLSDFNLEKYKKDSALLANVLTINNPVLTVYRDKFPPFLSGIIKPLPTDMIKNITLPVSVKRVDIVDGELSYTEKNAKSRAEGTIFLTRINGGLKKIKNSNIENDDSLTLTLKAYLMDSTWINLKVKQSYSDTLSGFLMTLKMKPTTLSFLNPVLAPLSNVQITSGTIDSFQLRAIANEYISLGEMKMYYHDLKIKLVKGGNQDKTTFFTKFASFIANTFVIKKDNKGRTGIIYFTRLRDRSFFNYIVKMTFSGMATSIGVKKNRKYIKKYKEELRKREMPALDIEELTP